METFASKGLHGFTLLGVWSDMSIEQQLMRDIKSELGVKTGRMISGNVDTTPTKWCATLTQKAKINAAMGTMINVEHESAKFNLHPDNQKSSIKKVASAIGNLLIWFEENDPFSSARDKNKFASFNTGLISEKDHDDINPEKADAVGLKLQKLLDNGNYWLTMPTSKKVKPLTYLWN